MLFFKKKKKKKKFHSAIWVTLWRSGESCIEEQSQRLGLVAGMVA